jgi:predicted O-methyltransferase YrrM
MMLSAIAISISLVTLTALFYQIRITKRINEKLLKLISPERDLRKVLKGIERAMRENSRQSEFYTQLLKLLNLNAPIPATRGWAASPDLLLTLHSLTKRYSPKTIVDLGSGLSTLVLAKSAPGAKIFSIDNSEEYATKTLSVLRDHAITNVQVRVAPLTPHAEGVDWYAVEEIDDIERVDLLFIDGPPGSKNSQARHPVIHEFLKKLSPSAIVVIDDVGREGERAIAEEFATLLPTHTIEFLPHEKGTAVITPR